MNSETSEATIIPAKTPAATESGDLGAPLYVAWQITNECNLACLHCIEESGPGKAFRDELSREQVLGVLAQLLDQQVPYLSFSGGEPMVHPHFFEMVEYVCARGGQLKIETNGHFLTPENERYGISSAIICSSTENTCASVSSSLNRFPGPLSSMQCMHARLHSFVICHAT